MKKKMKYVVCYSGGHSSALVAVEAVRKYGKDNVILLNHNISPKVEHQDIKRFKDAVADYLGIPITYANMNDWENMPPLEVAKKCCGFQFQVGQALCTYNLKTEPFYKWLDENYPSVSMDSGMNEPHRIQRRAQILGTKGYKTDFPLALWNRTIHDIEEIGINRPCTYEIFKHANCIGCLKAGKQHWYIVYCLYPDIFKQAQEAEKEIGHSIIKNVFLEELVQKYEAMKAVGIIPNDRLQAQTFWATVRKELGKEPSVPCECADGVET